MDTRRISASSQAAEQTDEQIPASSPLVGMATGEVSSDPCGQHGVLHVVGAEFTERSTPEALISTFESLLDGVDYREVLELLDVGALQFQRKKRLKQEFRALYIGLWRLALRRSFPDEYRTVFQTFMERQAQLVKDKNADPGSVELVFQYVDKLTEHGDTDFSEVGRHLLSLLEFDETQTRVMILKVALHLRRMYTYFFDHLL